MGVVPVIGKSVHGGDRCVGTQKLSVFVKRICACVDFSAVFIQAPAATRLLTAGSTCAAMT